MDIKLDDDIEFKDKFPIIPDEIPIVSLPNIAVFPYVIFPLAINDESLVKLINDSLISSKIIGVFAPKKSDGSIQSIEDLYPVGTIALVLKMFQMPGGSIRLLIQGLARAQMVSITQQIPYLKGKITRLTETSEEPLQIEALKRTATDLFIQIIQLSPFLPEELKNVVLSIQDASRLTDLIASNLNLELSEKQKILETLSVQQRLNLLIKHLNKETKLLELTGKIQSEVNTELNKSQREYFLREQLKAIRHELGEDEESSEVDELKKQIKKAKMPSEAEEVAKKELERLAMMSPASAEYTVSRTYIDWLVSLPWKVQTKDRINITKAKKILDEDHYDLIDVKDRILEFLAVHKLKPNTKSPILCFVGPPGVGKTSLGRSIARAMGRKFLRFSVGGMRDEAEIRGHRRTYIGALPGRIIQSLKMAGSKNPVFMIDEIDKIGSDFRGDPASALLEVLDPEQNFSFMDHYLDVTFDLSRIMFITTANTLYSIPSALLDRMEVLNLAGYIAEEKLEIAKRYLVPRQREQSGLKKEKIAFDDATLMRIITEYTRESGVRNLEREIGNVCRKVARKFAEGNKKPVHVKEKDIEEFLGARKVFSELAGIEDSVGIATGLAWTSVGGEVLFVEATAMPGNKSLILTGQLGDVMRESAQAALSYIRSRVKSLKLDETFFSRTDIHIHVPAGATPKDGPSAGVTMATALVSLLMGCPIRHDVAMTGEITLQGRVLPVGGIKEKVIAAKRAGIKTVILPKFNESDLKEVPDYIRKQLKFVFAENVQDVWKVALKISNKASSSKTVGFAPSLPTRANRGKKGKTDRVKTDEVKSSFQSNE